MKQLGLFIVAHLGSKTYTAEPGMLRIIIIKPYLRETGVSLVTKRHLIILKITLTF